MSGETIVSLDVETIDYLASLERKEIIDKARGKEWLTLDEFIFVPEKWMRFSTIVLSPAKFILYLMMLRSSLKSLGVMYHEATRSALNNSAMVLTSPLSFFKLASNTFTPAPSRAVHSQPLSQN
jgi:hypothetical protein